MKAINRLSYILVLSVGLGGAGAASAADSLPGIYRKANPPASYNWAGFYIGANVGDSYSNTNNGYIYAGFPITLVPSRTGENGAVGGAQAGYNWQSGQFVYGVEADASWRNASNGLIARSPNGIDVSTFTTKETWMATVRPRAGIAANNYLFYVTGGVAGEGLQHSLSENRTTVAGANRSVMSDGTRLGWTAGVGVEAGFGQWSVGLEYLYVDFGGRTTLSAPAQLLSGISFATSQATFDDSKQNIVRAKLNYHFNGPVAARY